MKRPSDANIRQRFKSRSVGESGKEGPKGSEE